MWSRLIILLVLIAFSQSLFAQTFPDDIELIGTVETITSSTMTINGQTVDISAAQIELAVFPGDVVRIEGTLNASGQIVARTVQAPGDDPQPDEVELVGIVDSISNTTVNIGNMVVDLAGAEIQGVIAVGLPLKVHATFAEDGTLRAREVQVGLAPTVGIVPEVASTPEVTISGPATTPEVTGEFEITGTLEQVGSGFIVVDGQSISITSAEIKDALVPGQLVKVHLRNQNGQLIAREIENANDDDGDNGNNVNRAGEFEITGTLEQVGSGFIVVNSQTISISGAEIKNTLVPGTLVKIHLSNQNGQLIAREVENALRVDDDDRGSNSGPGSGGDDDNSGPGSDDDDDDGGNSGSGGDDDNDD